MTLNILLMGMPGITEWVLIILVILLLFGGKKIPELMRGLGSGIREFNEAKSKVKSEIQEGMKTPPAAEKTSETK
ncbi:MAG TPA: twin-arginine translocase TatA/TatE family subunit [Bacteroidia bacterium]|nr:twin-arginine translocase TatA/TatE family subunit [Bacteroidia bacterium]